MSLRTGIAAVFAIAAAAPAAQAAPFDWEGVHGTYVVPPSAAPTGGGVSAAAAARSYGGHTTEGAPIAFRVSGRRLTQMAVQGRADCDSNQAYPVAITFVSAQKSTLPLLEGGKLKRTGAFAAGGRGDADLGSQLAVVTVLTQGKLRPKSSSGLLLIDVTITDKASGQQADHCTAALKWTEKVPERLVYSGISAQANPVVVELTRNRKKVKTFWFGFYAQCAPDGAIAPADAVTNFPIGRAGRFGDDFGFDGSDGSGGTLHVDYRLRGKVSRARASGLFSVVATDRDAAGTTLFTCDSGEIAWSTRQ